VHLVQAQGGTAVVRRRAAIAALFVIAADQITKSAVVAALREGESQPIIGDLLRLTHIKNTGAAFGMLRGLGGVLALAALVGVIAFAAVVVRQPPPLTSIGAALVAAGAMGNLIDRLFREGGVVDFVDFRYWPAFNVADSAITIGAVLLLWAGMREGSGSAKEASPTGGEPDEPAHRGS
jgi:signal peptidase II